MGERQLIHRLLTAACLIAALASWSAVSAAQTSKAPQWQEFDLLQGRLLMQAPEGAAYENVPAANIMAADPSAERVTQIRVSAAGTEIVVQVTELFALYPGDPARFFADVVWGGETPEGAQRPGPIEVAAPLVAYGVADGSYPHPSGNNVLASLLVGQGDGTAQYVYVMTWDVDATTLKQVSAVAARMVLSLRAGPRQDIQAGGERTLATLPAANGEAQTLRIDLPAGFVLSTDQGPDFTVHYVNRLTALDADSGGSLGIYTGSFPASIFERMDLPAGGLSKVPVTLLGSKREWTEGRTPDDSGGPAWIHREAMIRSGDSAGHGVLHIFYSAPGGSAAFDELTRIVEEKLRLTRP